MINETMEFARHWLVAARNTPDKIGSVYPSHPPISFEMLNELISAVDGVECVPLPIPSFKNSLPQKGSFGVQE